MFDNPLLQLKRLFRRMKKNREWNKRRRLSDHRATSLAVRLTLTGALKSCTRGVRVIGRQG
jgi:hypothetical protein